MAIKILTNEKNTLEMDLGDIDLALAQVLTEKLSKEKDVEFAACKKEHPLVNSTRLLLKTKKGEPAKLLLEKLEEMKKEVSEFKKEFLDIAK